jgi:hypothetical protein
MRSSVMVTNDSASRPGSSLSRKYADRTAKRISGLIRSHTLGEESLDINHPTNRRRTLISFSSKATLSV